MEEINSTDQKFFARINLLLVSLIIVGAFLILPPSKNFGDQPTQNVHFQEKLVEYNESDFKGTFTEYYKHIWSDYFKDKLKKKELQGKYSLNPNIPGITRAERVKALIRLLELGTYYLSFKTIEMESAFILSSLFILLATYFYSYKLGSEIASPIFGSVLAVVITSNIYFNQLVRSGMQNEVLVYPFLFCMSFHYLLRLHNTENIRKTSSVFGLGLSIGLSVANGYPNSTLILIPSLGIFSLAIWINSLLGNKKYKRTAIVNYILVVLAASFFTVVFSAIWSKLLGEGIFYHLSIITTRWDRITMVTSFANATFFDSQTFAVFIATFKNVFDLLINGSFIYNAPHEPGMLVRLGFFNIFENILLIVGLLVLSTRLLKRETLNIFLVFILATFTVRALSGTNLYVDKSNYDYYFLLQFIVSYGFYYLATHDFIRLNAVNILNRLKKPANSSPDDSFAYSKSAGKTLICFFLIIILSVNMYHFNKGFVYDQSEGLGYYSGLYQLRKFVKNEINDDKDLLILDYRWGDIFTPDNVTFLAGKFKWEVLLNLRDLFDSREDMKSALQNGTYSNIYAVMPGPLATIKGKHFHHGGRRRFLTGFNFFEYVSPSNHYRTIKDRQGKPLYYIYKITREDDYQTIKINPKSKTENISIDLLPGHYLDYIDFPGTVSKATLSCNYNGLIINLSRASYDYFHFSFDKNSVVEIYNKLGADERNVVSSERILRNKPAYKKNTRYNYLSSQGGKANIDYKYEFGFPIDDVLMNVPYFLYQDRNRINTLAIQFKKEDESRWKTFRKVVSNGKEEYGNWHWKPPWDPFSSLYNISGFIDSFAGVINANGAGHIYLRYNIRTRTFGYTYGARYLSTRNSVPEFIPHFFIFSLDTSIYSHFASNCRGKLYMNLSFGENKEYSLQQLFVGVGSRKIPG